MEHGRALALAVEAAVGVAQQQRLLELLLPDALDALAPGLRTGGSGGALVCTRADTLRLGYLNVGIPRYGPVRLTLDFTTAARSMRVSSGYSLEH